MYSAAFRNKNGTRMAPPVPRPKAVASGWANIAEPTSPTTAITSSESRVQAANIVRPVAPLGGSW